MDERKFSNKNIMIKNKGLNKERPFLGIVNIIGSLWLKRSSSQRDDYAQSNATNGIHPKLEKPEAPSSFNDDQRSAGMRRTARDPSEETQTSQS